MRYNNWLSKRYRPISGIKPDEWHWWDSPYPRGSSSKGFIAYAAMKKARKPVSSLTFVLKSKPRSTVSDGDKKSATFVGRFGFVFHAVWPAIAKVSDTRRLMNNQCDCVCEVITSLGAGAKGGRMNINCRLWWTHEETKRLGNFLSGKCAGEDLRTFAGI